MISEKILRMRIRRAYRKDWRGKYQSNLVAEYKNIFRHLKLRKIRILELGIDYGGSLLFWSDFFMHPRAMIIGLDIKLPEGITFPKRVAVRQCDQNDSIALEKIAKQYGPFDIIIDDASHWRKETENSFNALMRYVKPGGYYIIEDWSVGYMGGEFEGMTSLIANIIVKARDVDIESLRVIQNNSTLAAFRGSTAIFRRKNK